MTKQHELFASTVANLARAVELRDVYTGEHSAVGEGPNIVDMI